MYADELDTAIVLREKINRLPECLNWHLAASTEMLRSPRKEVHEGEGAQQRSQTPPTCCIPSLLPHSSVVNRELESVDNRAQTGMGRPKGAGCKLKNQAARKEPTPCFKRTLLAKSVNKSSWQAACAEWGLIHRIEADPIYGDDSPPSAEGWEFTSNCELCGARLSRYNCIIQNKETGEYLRVGTECVKRFEALNGVAAGEDIEAYVDRWAAHLDHVLTLRRYAVDLGFATVDRNALFKFLRAAEALWGRIQTEADWERLGPTVLETVKVPPDRWLANRIRQAFLAPLSLPLSRSSEAKPRVESEAALRRKLYGRKRTLRVDNITAGRSEEYRRNRLDPGSNER